MSRFAKSTANFTRPGPGIGALQRPGGAVLFLAPRPPQLPQSGLLRFFQIIDATERDSEGYVTARKIRVVASTIAGEIPAGMSALDDPVYSLTVSGDGEVYAAILFDPDTGEIVSPAILQAEETPESTDTTKTRVLGGFSVPGAAAEPIAVNNVVYGPLTASACRDWFSFPVTYGFSWGE